VGCELAKIAAHRLNAMILGGGSPYTEDMRVHLEGDPNDKELVRAKLLSLFGMTRDTVPEKYKNILLANDFLAIHRSLCNRPSSESALEKMTMPCLVYVGDQDPRIEPSNRVVARLSNAELVELKELAHLPAMFNKDTVMPHAKAFLASLQD
jgi:pimeloyl-ACP methyl ester carboxylesterase